MCLVLQIFLLPGKKFYIVNYILQVSVTLKNTTNHTILISCRIYRSVWFQVDSSQMYLSYSNFLLDSVFLSATLRFKLHTLNPFISTTQLLFNFFSSFFSPWNKLLKVFSTLCSNSTIKYQKCFFFLKMLCVVNFFLV